MSFIKIATDRSRTTLAILLFLIIAGSVAYTSIPKESDPDITIPFIYVSLSHDGISPADAVRHLIRPMEHELRSIEGVKELRGTAFDGGANIQIEFEAGFDSAKALDDVREKVDKAEVDLPDDTRKPEVLEVNLSRFPVLSLALYGDINERELIKQARLLKEHIEGFAEILEVNIIGERKEQINVLINPYILESYKLDTAELLQSFNRAVKVIPAGNLESASGKFAVRIPSLIENPNDILDLPIKTNTDASVKVRDIAQVLYSYKDIDSYARTNGKPGVILEISKRTGENTIKTIEKIRSYVAETSQNWPASMQFSFSNDSSKQIKTMLDDLTNNILSAVLLVLIVILGTLGFRAGFLVGLAIPGSFLMGILILYSLGLTVNVVVLFALILSTGMLVDGAIVVSESAERILAEGYSAKEAYQQAAGRMAWPIISSTTTTLAAFLPLVFWPGIVGEFMKFLPITLIATLSASLLMALVFVPVVGMFLPILARIFVFIVAVFATITILPNIAAKILPLAAPIMTFIALILGVVLGYFIQNLLKEKFPDTSQHKTNPSTDLGKSNITQNNVGREIIRFNKTGLTGAYLQLLSLALRFPKIVMCGAAITLIGSYSIYIFYGKGVEFFPNIDPDRFNIYIENRDNLSIYEKDEIARTVEMIVLDFKNTTQEISNVNVAVGDLKQRANIAMDTIINITVELADWHQRRSSAEIEQALRDRLNHIPGIKMQIVAEKGGPPSDKPIHIEFSGTDITLLNQSVEHLLSYIKTDPDFIDIEDSLPLPGLEWKIDIDLTQASKFGIDQQIMGDFVQLVTSGKKLTEIRPEGSTEDVDIRVRYPQSFRTLNGIKDLRVNTINGTSIPVGTFANIISKPKTSVLYRKDGKAVSYVKTGLKSGVLADSKVQILQAWLAKNPLPNGIAVEYLGEDEDKRDAQDFLIKAFSVALFIMAAILLTQFNSFFGAFLILSAVVMSTVGVLLGLIIRGQPFGIIMSGIGVIALAGIVVNNNIVLIDTFMRLRKKTGEAKRAILLTCAQRLRPVLLTTVTTILGLMPMVLQINIEFFNHAISYNAPSTQWWTQLATAISFGLVFSTILTLIVTPTALYLGRNLISPQNSSIIKFKRDKVKIE